MQVRLWRVWFGVVLLLPGCSTWAEPAEDVVQQRMSADVKAGKPIVVHVVVALCDNKNQGIVPVPATLGNGQDAARNLYWGAAYGVRTFLSRKETGWKLLSDLPNGRPEILDKIVLSDTILRDSKRIPVYLVAEAWDGKEMRAAIQRFFTLAAGREPETIELSKPTGHKIDAGSKAHLVVFVGHNGLMDYTPSSTAMADSSAQPRSAMVLACASDFYFRKRLNRAGAHPILLTTGLMAPEAYTLDAAVRAWISDMSPANVVESAASAYNRYQNCGIKAARRLFTTGP